MKHLDYVDEWMFCVRPRSKMSQLDREGTESVQGMRLK